MNKNVMLGQRFGRLQVYDEVLKLVPQTYIKCVCDCGKEIITRPWRLVHGKCQSCGCLAKELSRKRRLTHGKTKTPEYQAWLDLRRRCYNKQNLAYRHYGGRGITVCPQWQYSFGTFLKDVGPRPNAAYSIDRINNNGNYEPSNCRWATKTQQSRNRRNIKSNV